MKFHGLFIGKRNARAIDVHGSRTRSTRTHTHARTHAHIYVCSGNTFLVQIVIEYAHVLSWTAALTIAGGSPSIIDRTVFRFN